MKSNAEDVTDQQGGPESVSGARFLWWSLERRALMTIQAILLSAAVIFAVIAGWRAWLSYHVNRYTTQAVSATAPPQMAALPPGVVKAALLLEEDEQLRSSSVVLSTQSYDFTKKLPEPLEQSTREYLALNAQALATLERALSPDGDAGDSYEDRPYDDQLRERMRWLGSMQLAEAVLLGNEEKPGEMVDALIRAVDLGVALRGVPDLQGQQDAQLIEWQAINPHMRRAIYSSNLSSGHLAQLRTRLLQDDAWPISAAELAAGERLRILDVVAEKGNEAVVARYGTPAQNVWQASDNWKYAAWIFGTDMSDRFDTLTLLQSVIDADKQDLSLERLRDAREELHTAGPMTAAVTETLHDVLWGRFLLEADRRVMATTFAVLEYRQDHGRLPDALADLVPQYFQKLPEDPFRRLRPINYSRAGEGFVVYSVGIDGDDDKGRNMLSLSSPEGDLTFRWRPADQAQNLRTSQASSAADQGAAQPAADAIVRWR